MKMKIKALIEGRVVEKEDRSIGDFDLYSWMEDHDSNGGIYFVNKKDDEVCGCVEFSADCGQNFGYISDVIIKDINDIKDKE